MKLSAAKAQKLKRCALGLGGLFLASVIWIYLPISSQLETATLDWRYRHVNRSTPFSDRVVVIDIDEISLKNLSGTYGRWPFPRRIYKEMLEFLMLGEPKAVLFDILFSEAQLDTDDDQQLGEASQITNFTSHAIQLLPEPSYEGIDLVDFPAEVGTRMGLAVTPSETTLFQTYRDFQLPTESVLKLTPYTHVVNVEKDEDGVQRRIPFLFKYQDVYLPSLSSRALTASLKQPRIVERKNFFEIYEGDQLAWTIPVNSKGEYQLHFYQQKPQFFSLSAVIQSAQIIQRGEVEDPSHLPVNPFQFKDKFILIGTSATGLMDLKSTPIDESWPGVFLHATAISNMLQGEYLKPWPRLSQIAVALILMLICYASVLYSESIFIKVGVPLVSISAYLGLALFLFRSDGQHVYMATPTLFMLAAFGDSFVYMGIMEARKRKQLGGTLSKYLSPAVTQQLIENDINPSAEIGKSEELSILFSDVRGFTTMSEKMPPEYVVLHLNEYLKRMTDIIFNNNGTLDKFIGDAVMAFWGAPLADPQHALKAVRTSMQMRAAVEELNLEWAAKGEVQFHIGVGVNTGRVIVGNIGSDKKLDYTVIGDNVNLASRIEGLTKQYGVEQLIGPKTYDLVKTEILCRPIDLVQVKGKKEAVKIYEPMLDLKATVADAQRIQEQTEEFTEAWQLYVEGEFAKAQQIFAKLQSGLPEENGPCTVYIERCQTLQADPPKDWTGVFVATSK